MTSKSLGLAHRQKCRGLKIKSEVLNSATVWTNYSATGHFIFRLCLACGYSFFLTCTIFFVFMHDLIPVAKVEHMKQFLNRTKP